MGPISSPAGGKNFRTAALLFYLNVIPDQLWWLKSGRNSIRINLYVTEPKYRRVQLKPHEYYQFDEVKPVRNWTV